MILYRSPDVQVYASHVHYNIEENIQPAKHPNRAISMY